MYEAKARCSQDIRHGLPVWKTWYWMVAPSAYFLVSMITPRSCLRKGRFLPVQQQCFWSVTSVSVSAGVGVGVASVWWRWPVAPGVAKGWRYAVVAVINPGKPVLKNKQGNQHNQADRQHRDQNCIISASAVSSPPHVIPPKADVNNGGQATSLLDPDPVYFRCVRSYDDHIVVNRRGGFYVPPEAYDIKVLSGPGIEKVHIAVVVAENSVGLFRRLP